MNQLMKVLVGYDGSGCADASLHDLRRAGLPGVAEAVVMSVADVLLPPRRAEREAEEPPPPMAVRDAVRRARASAEQAVEEAEAFAHQGRERLQTFFPSWHIQAEACADSPAWGLIQKAEAWQPDLIVVGSHGRSALGRLVLGSVAQTVLTHAHTSVRVARGREDAQEGPVRLIIGVDGSADADAAVRAVATRVWPAGSEAHVIAAVDRMLTTASQPLDASGEEDGDWPRRVVEAVAEALRATGLVVSALVAEGDPKRCLLAEAETWGADGIFLGARGLRGIERLLLGSVSTAVTARAHCSVEVVRPSREG
jgi:nucleotide-binding universal stress UspA family protein